MDLGKEARNAKKSTVLTEVVSPVTSDSSLRRMNFPYINGSLSYGGHGDMTQVTSKTSSYTNSKSISAQHHMTALSIYDSSSHRNMLHQHQNLHETSSTLSRVGSAEGLLNTRSLAPTAGAVRMNHLEQHFHQQVYSVPHHSGSAIETPNGGSASKPEAHETNPKAVGVTSSSVVSRVRINSKDANLHLGIDVTAGASVEKSENNTFTSVSTLYTSPNTTMVSGGDSTFNASSQTFEAAGAKGLSTAAKLLHSSHERQQQYVKQPSSATVVNFDIKNEKSITSSTTANNSASSDYLSKAIVHHSTAPHLSRECRFSDVDSNRLGGRVAVPPTMMSDGLSGSQQDHRDDSSGYQQGQTIGSSGISFNVSPQHILQVRDNDGDIHFPGGGDSSIPHMEDAFMRKTVFNSHEDKGSSNFFHGHCYGYDNDITFRAPLSTNVHQSHKRQLQQNGLMGGNILFSSDSDLPPAFNHPDGRNYYSQAAAMSRMNSKAKPRVIGCNYPEGEGNVMTQKHPLDSSRSKLRYFSDGAVDENTLMGVMGGMQQAAVHPTFATRPGPMNNAGHRLHDSATMSQMMLNQERSLGFSSRPDGSLTVVGNSATAAASLVHYKAHSLSLHHLIASSAPPDLALLGGSPPSCHQKNITDSMDVEVLDDLDEADESFYSEDPGGLIKKIIDDLDENCDTAIGGGTEDHAIDNSFASGSSNICDHHPGHHAITGQPVNLNHNSFDLREEFPVARMVVDPASSRDLPSSLSEEQLQLRVDSGGATGNDVEIFSKSASVPLENLSEDAHGSGKTKSLPSKELLSAEVPANSSNPSPIGVRKSASPCDRPNSKYTSHESTRSSAGAGRGNGPGRGGYIRSSSRYGTSGASRTETLPVQEDDVLSHEKAASPTLDEFTSIYSGILPIDKDSEEEYESDLSSLLKQMDRREFHESWSKDWTLGLVRFCKYMQLAEKMQIGPAIALPHDENHCKIFVLKKIYQSKPPAGWPAYGVRLQIQCGGFLQDILSWSNMNRPMWKLTMPLIEKGISQLIQKVGGVQKLRNGHQPYFNACRNALRENYTLHACLKDYSRSVTTNKRKQRSTNVSQLRAAKAE